MRTKSRAVRRHSIDQTLQGDGSVGAGTGAGSLGSVHDFNGSPNSSTRVEGFNDDGSFLGSVNGNWVGTRDVPATLGVFMDVDDGLHSVNGTAERPSAIPAVVAASMTLSNGNIINEPHLCRNRFPVTVDVAGKGKRKVGDVAASVDNDYDASGHCISDTPLVGGCVADSSSASCTCIAADVGAGSSSSSFPVVNPGFQHLDMLVSLILVKVLFHVPVKT